MPDFRMQPNSFPIASVIDAATKNAQLQQRAREEGNQSLIAGLQSIGQVGESLYTQKVRMAQALAGAKMYGQTPEGQQMLGTNPVADTAQGPVTSNQTANYNPATGTATPNQSPVQMKDLQTAMLGESPSNMLTQLFNRQKERQQIALDTRKQAFTEHIKPIELAQQADLTRALTGVKASQVSGEQASNIRNQLTALEGKKTGIIRDFPELAGSIISGVLPEGLNQKETAAIQDYKDTQKQIDDYNHQLYGGSSAKNTAHMSTADLLAIVNQASPK